MGILSSENARRLTSNGCQSSLKLTSAEESFLNYSVSSESIWYQTVTSPAQPLAAKTELIRDNKLNVVFNPF